MPTAGDEGLAYWLRWEVPVCALIFLLPAIAAILVIIRANQDHLEAKDLWIPCWRKLHPVWLLVYRAFVFFVMSFILVQMIARHGAFTFYFYTQWTFALVIVYFMLGTVISAHGCWLYWEHHVENGETDQLINADLEESTTTVNYSACKTMSTIKVPSHHDQAEVTRRAGFWGYTLQTVYQTCAGAAVLTDIVFWGLLVPFLSNKGFGLNLLRLSMHSLNALFLLIDTFLNSMPFPWFRLAYFVLWTFLYGIFQWILHACGFTWWPYPFLELSTPWAPVWYICLALIHIPCYSLYALIVKVKYLMLSRLFPQACIKSF